MGRTVSGPPGTTACGAFQTQANSLISGPAEGWSGARLPVPRGLLVLTIVLLPIALLLMVLLPLVDQEKSKVRW